MANTLYIIRLNHDVIAFNTLDEAIEAYDMAKKCFYKISTLKAVALEKLTGVNRITLAIATWDATGGSNETFNME